MAATGAIEEFVLDFLVLEFCSTGSNRPIRPPVLRSP
jgi:hypothetical protein